MKSHSIQITLSIPEDSGLTLMDLEDIARQNRYSLDEWISRCVLTHTLEVKMASPTVVSSDIPEDLFGSLSPKKENRR